MEVANLINRYSNNQAQKVGSGHAFDGRMCDEEKKSKSVLVNLLRQGRYLARNFQVTDDEGVWRDDVKLSEHS